MIWVVGIGFALTLLTLWEIRQILVAIGIEIEKIGSLLKSCDYKLNLLNSNVLDLKPSRQSTWSP